MATPKCDRPFLMFCMQLDTSGAALPGLNKGRLTLWDHDKGCVGRWVFTSGSADKQVPNGWNLPKGGVLPPNYQVKPPFTWYEVPTKLVIQPGQPVDRGFYIKENGDMIITTKDGATRSEGMIHEDKPPAGSWMCLVAQKAEYQDFEKTFIEACGHLPSVKLGVVYTF